MAEKLKLKWVSDLIGDDYINWIPDQKIFIESQTGTGKNTFIIEKLLPHAKSLQTKVLYLCNRRNLKSQFKKDIAKKLGININDMPKEEFDKLRDFGKITIRSYQELETIIMSGDDLAEKIKISEYGYIVFDECHYFIQDSLFNPFTNNILPGIMKSLRGKSPTTIYMSATLYEVKEYIETEDRAIYFKEYKQEHGNDYSYIKVKYFDDMNQITKIINNDKSNDKWLIFMNNIEKGNKFREEINQSDEEDLNTIYDDSQKVESIVAKIGSSFIYSETRGALDADSKSEIESLINDGKFDLKCMIATKVLDNGINFDDELLKNIVISTFDKTDFIQMIGRKRININNPQEITVYIDAKNAKSFNGWLNTNISVKLNSLSIFENYPSQILYDFFSDRKFNSMMFGMIYHNKKEVIANNLAMQKLQRQEGFCRYIIDKFKSENDGNIAYIKRQLLWLGLEETYSEECWIDAEKRTKNNAEKIKKCKESREFLEKRFSEIFESEKSLDANEQTKFREELSLHFNNIDILSEKFSISKKPNMKIINQCLEQISDIVPYRIYSSQLKGKGTIWNVVTIDDYNKKNNKNNFKEEPVNKQKIMKVCLVRGEEIIRTSDDIIVNKKQPLPVIRAELVREPSFYGQDIYW